MRRVWSIAAMGYSELVGTALGFEAVKGNKGVMRFNSNGNEIVGTAPGLTCLKWNCRFDGSKNLRHSLLQRQALHKSKHFQALRLVWPFGESKRKGGRIYRHCAGFVVLQRWRGLIGASENEFNCFAEEQDFSKYDILFYKAAGLV